jgi:Protein of unknown function (DUF3311)
VKAALIVLVLAVAILHQDSWFWTDKSLVLGFLPVGLAYHAFYAVLASVTMAVLVKFLWPAQLDEDGAEGSAA